MRADDVVTGIVESIENRKTLLELSAELGLADDSNLLNTLRADEERIVMHLVSIFNSREAEDAVLRLKGNSAQAFLDIVQEALSRELFVAQEHSWKARRLIRKLSKACDMLPSALFITGVTGREEHPTFGGGYGDVYRASYDNKPVALKHLRHFLRDSGLRRVRLKFCREALVWKDLHHPHILSFIGIDRESFPSSLCMVSPWMEHGTVLNYLKHHGRGNVDKLLFEITEGLRYLHSRNIVHGDLRGASILINQNRSACLADFGLSVFSNTTSSTRTSTRAGSLYWMAPELIDPVRFGHSFIRTPATDIYAFGCVCVELYTGRPPLSEMSEAAALLAVINGERAERPSGTPAMSDVLWKQVTACWAENPAARPTTELVVHKMAQLAPAQRKALRPLPPLPRSSSSGALGEDMQQLLWDCKVGVGSAALLIEVLAMTAPEDLGNALITEFHEVCITLQKRISMQIPWVLGRAERARLVKDDREERVERRDRYSGKNHKITGNPNTQEIDSDTTGESTREEELLVELLSANVELLEALRIYDDLERLATEREVGRKTTRVDSWQEYMMDYDNTFSVYEPGRPRQLPRPPSSILV
ncbi:kinase-like domain-containing protein [Mycena latifolia]|nr:kinase-like domain-containing protein [Mycena latifolia]